MNGLIAYYGLEDWWWQGLNDDERSLLENGYKLFGCPIERPLTNGSFQNISGPIEGVAFLFAGLLVVSGRKPVNRRLRTKLFDLFEGYIQDEQNLLARHYCLQTLIQERYSDRFYDPNSEDSAINACYRQIDLADQVAILLANRSNALIPCHTGYERLAILLERRHLYSECIRICQQALDQGWIGTWKNRIDRCVRKQASER